MESKRFPVIGINALIWVEYEYQSGYLRHTFPKEEAPHVKKAAEKVGGRHQQTLVKFS